MSARALNVALVTLKPTISEEECVVVNLPKQLYQHELGWTDSRLGHRVRQYKFR